MIKIKAFEQFELLIIICGQRTLKRIKSRALFVSLAKIHAFIRTEFCQRVLPRHDLATSFFSSDVISFAVPGQLLPETSPFAT